MMRANQTHSRELMIDGWLNSKEARKRLRVSTCELAHLRESGKLAFRKVGNAYLYAAADCLRQFEGQNGQR